MTALGTIIGRGVLASRPSAGIAGQLYYGTDTLRWYRDNGSSWDDASGNPMTTSGDIVYGGASGLPTRLAKGTDGQVLTLASGLPSWAGGGGSSSPVLSTTAYRSGASTITLYAQGPLTSGNVMFLAVSTIQYNVSSISQTNVTWTLVDKGDLASGNQQHTELWKGVISANAKNKIVVTMAGNNSCYAVAAEFSYAGTVGSNGNATHAGGGDCTSTSISSSSGNLIVAALGYRSGTGEPCGVYGGLRGLPPGQLTNQIGTPVNIAWAVSTGSAMTIGIQDTGDNMAMAWAVVTA